MKKLHFQSLGLCHRTDSIFGTESQPILEPGFIFRFFEIWWMCALSECSCLTCILYDVLREPYDMSIVA